MKKTSLIMLSCLLAALNCNITAFPVNASENPLQTEEGTPIEPVMEEAQAYEEISQLVFEFYNAKNSFYQDTSNQMDRKAMTYSEVMQFYTDQLQPYFYDWNYSTDFFIQRLAYFHEEYRIREADITEYQSAILEIKNFKLLGGGAEADIIERIDYQDSTRKQGSACKLYAHAIFQYTGDEWKILKFVNDEPFYTSYYNEEGASPSEVFTEALNGLYSDAAALPEALLYETVPVVNYEKTILYDGDLAAEYARTYSMSYNPQFPNYRGSGGDCANFGSQSVWAGLGGTELMRLPMLAEGASYERLWYQGAYSGSTGKYWNWTSTSRFYQYIVNGNPVIPGLYGKVIPISQARPGDIIQVDYQNNGSVDHTVVVTGVDNPDSTNGIMNITYSAHTGDRKEHPLSEFGYRAGFRVLRIYGMVSPVEQSQYWAKDENGWYYQANGVRIMSECKKIGSNWYFFDENGYLETGWIYYKDEWYYAGIDGKMKTGWIMDEQAWYYLQEDGSLLTNAYLEENEQLYYFDENGKWMEDEQSVQAYFSSSNPPS